MARTTVLLVAVALFFGAAPAGAAPRHRALTLPLAAIYGYATPTIQISKGDRIVYTNLDIDRHNIVQDVAADGKGGKPNVHWCKDDHGDDHHHDHSAGCPVFWSPLIGSQQTVEVEGLDRVKRGETYTFFCTLHHSMKGTLTVRP